MNEDEFVVLNNKAIFVNSSARFYNSSEYVWQNRSLFICENYDESTSKNDHVLIILTDVCMSISIIALVFVLVTYSLFAELRTNPSINLMNLSIAILLAQFLWLIGSEQTNTPMACTAIAVLLHYFFLVSFMWTSIIAFDTWRAFTAKGRRSMADSKRKRLLHALRYMAVGWLSAMVYVAICVALDLTNTVSIGYQSSKVCWMSNKMAVLYIFTAPVSLILAFNFVMYILTMKAINVTTAQARAAADHENRKNLFFIYIRIASAMGFTWILGFIAPFKMDFLWYPFVVLNGLQGLYIALAFGLNQRARRLWKMLFGAVTMTNKNNCSAITTSNHGITSSSIVAETRL
ncbi:latrophilin receptor-like protein A [Exaiptasia diaphana]|uniref:G-protein coupled receptors family 2 profile 2 domain-containing protein n=1 Tax=Exaiptasia diaphana TaxID=2652724 RepID=A0A913YQ72_EXADI|nr:latrophilin receptor-like protein A [Exaiptasia diaphana]